MKGLLTLVPTPIDDDSPLEQSAFTKLNEAVSENQIIVVEEAKTCRRRWLKWGLPREAIEKFVLYNEHTSAEEAPRLLKEMNKGNSVYLLSDCGLPAFCDPGRLLVELCHQSAIQVTATPFPNSISLAVALSGFPHDRFIFEGFIPARGAQRSKELKRIMSQKEVSVLMDTPYRLESLLKEMKKEMKEIKGQREVFLAMELNKKGEKLLRAPLENIQPPKEKAEFILILGAKS
ncbi:MAG: SAM-dependent methyltransferase [Bacteriovoracaceae bacterium]